MLFELQIQGYKPIIAQPEKNKSFQDNPSEHYELVKKGALTQISALSLNGVFGKKVQKFANQLLKLNLTHFIASSARSSKQLQLRSAVDQIEKKHGSSIAFTLTENQSSIRWKSSGRRRTNSV
ncbi:hypothetical protein FN924_15550 [Radiobacillus deserti]|uniref:protein-tyrosine-phosphatase n=1 Tax=Radiobacillus deserti TaxID=2594883 RepID=A0A516KJ95_9BACI|nr:hypothetical protein FN924_15550 [Radiobacillus deserti]